MIRERFHATRQVKSVCKETANIRSVRRIRLVLGFVVESNRRDYFQ
jgi:hypothetical protein